MRPWTIGIVAGLAMGAVVVGASSPRAEAQAQPAPVPASVKPLMLADGILAFSSDTADGFQQVVVIDTKTKAMSVYHIAHKTGTSTLKSARNLQADLELDEYNTENPVPREIRAMLNKR